MLEIEEDSVRNEDDTGFPKLPAPARRALSAAGYTRLKQLADVSEVDLKKLHGMAPTAIAVIREALVQRGLSFQPSVPASSRLVPTAASAEDVDEYLRAVKEPLPFSGSVLGQLADELDDYTMTKSSLHFPVDRPLPKALVKKLIAVRLADVGGRGH